MSELPAIKAIKDVLDGLLGRDVNVAPADALTSADTVGGVMATYVDDGNALAAVIGWDLPLAANVGAAVALVPKGGAEAAMEDNYLPENLLENLGEVNNVLASVFDHPNNPHVRLRQSFRPIGDAPDDALQLMYALGNRVDLSVDVPGYGDGRLGLSMRF